MNPKSLISTVTIIRQESKNHFEALVSFQNPKFEDRQEDSVTVTKSDNIPEFQWKNRSFSPSAREYLELRAQVEVENELLLKRSEINS